MVEIGDGEADVDAVVCLEMGEPRSTVRLLCGSSPKSRALVPHTDVFLVTLLPPTSHSGHE